MKTDFDFPLYVGFFDNTGAYSEGRIAYVGSEQELIREVEAGPSGAIAEIKVGKKFVPTLGKVIDLQAVR